MGIWPRATTAATYGVLAWSPLIELAGGFFSSSHWLLDTSVFHQMAAAPAVSPDWTSAAAMTALAAATALAGVARFSRAASCRIPPYNLYNDVGYLSPASPFWMPGSRSR